jgi:hypothetical protein
MMETNNTAPLVWHTEQRKVSDLIPFEDNPRFLTDKQKADLTLDSILNNI